MHAVERDDALGNVLLQRLLVVEIDSGGRVRIVDTHHLRHDQGIDVGLRVRRAVRHFGPVIELVDERVEDRIVVGPGPCAHKRVQFSRGERLHVRR